MWEGGMIKSWRFFLKFEKQEVAGGEKDSFFLTFSCEVFKMKWVFTFPGVYHESLSQE